MSAIDEYLRDVVFASAEAPLRSFTLDRDNAVTLLRDFALADPHFYILELVQAAVANGASHFHVDLVRYGDQVDLRVRFDGQSFSRLELTNLFDYLFEADEEEHADILLLARGINGVRYFQPRHLEIFAPGLDGGAPTALSIDPELADSAMITPDEGDLRRGEFSLRAFDLRGMPDHLRFARAFRPKWPEATAIEERTGFADLAITFNSHTAKPKIRVPDDALQVDEPGLRGSLWPGGDPFSLVTYGVAVELLLDSTSPFAGLSGYIRSDGFRKTADQYRVVRNSHFDHVVARLDPYLRSRRDQSADQTTGDDPSHLITDLDGAHLTPEDLREILGTHRRVLAVPPALAEREPGTVANAADRLEAHPLITAASQLSTLRALALDGTEVISLDWDAPGDRDFLHQRPHEAPARPWLVEPLPVRPLWLSQLTNLLSERTGITPSTLERFRQAAGSHSRAHATVYTPARDGQDAAEVHRHWVQIRSCDRLIFSGTTTVPHPGHVLLIDLPPISPTFLGSAPAPGASHTWARHIAEVFAAEATEELAMANRLALRSIAHAESDAGSMASRIAMRSMASDLVLRLRSDTDDDGVTFELAYLSEDPPDRALSLVSTVSGQPLDLDGLAAHLGRCRGVLPFVTDPEALPPESPFGPDEALLLDDELQTLLAELMGPDVLHHIEPTPPMPPDELLQALRDDDLPRSAYFALRRRALQLLLGPLEPGDRHREALDSLNRRPLIDTAEGLLSLDQVLTTHRAGRPLVMLDGRSGSQASHGQASPSAPLELKMNPALAAHLHDGNDLRGAFDFPYPQQESSDYLVERPVAESRFSGTVGLLWPPPAHGHVALYDREAHTTYSLPLEEDSLLAGVLQTTDSPEGWRDEVTKLLHGLEEELLTELLRAGAALGALLHFTTRHLHLTVDPAGVHHYDITHPLAEEILDLPLAVTDGFPITGRRLIRNLCLFADGAVPLDLTSRQLLPPEARDWAAETLRKDRFVSTVRSTESPRPSTATGPLEAVTAWLEHLWPHHLGGPTLQLPIEPATDGPLPAVPMAALIAGDHTYFGYLLIDRGVRIQLFTDHHMVREALSSGSSTSSFTVHTASLLYGIYDGLRALFEMPEDHELAFQKALTLALLDADSPN